MEDNKAKSGYAPFKGHDVPKSIISMFYHDSMEIFSDSTIPGQKFGSPAEFEREVISYKSTLEGWLRALNRTAEEVKDSDADIPHPLYVVLSLVESMKTAIDFVLSKRVAITPSTCWFTLSRIARRLHESVLSLKKHPHGGTILAINDEWDAQYLFRALLVTSFDDIRIEEWNPSTAGSSSKCEFFLKDEKTLVEIKYVRKPSCQKRIKDEIAVDILDYGNNDKVDRLFVFIYDPDMKLENPVQVERDLSGKREGLGDVRVVIGPPRFQ